MVTIRCDIVLIGVGLLELGLLDVLDHGYGVYESLVGGRSREEDYLEVAVEYLELLEVLI